MSLLNPICNKILLLCNSTFDFWVDCNINSFTLLLLCCLCIFSFVSSIQTSVLSCLLFCLCLILDLMVNINILSQLFDCFSFNCCYLCCVTCLLSHFLILFRFICYSHCCVACLLFSNCCRVIVIPTGLIETIVEIIDVLFHFLLLIVSLTFPIGLVAYPRQWSVG